jgi:hypothetical protein
MQEYLREFKEKANEIENIKGFSKTYDVMFNEFFPNLIDGDLLEVGVFRGKTTMFLGKYLEIFYPEKILYSIDHHDPLTFNCRNVKESVADVKKRFLFHMKELKNHIHYSMISEEGIKLIKDDSLCFAFIDGDHTKEGVIKDFSYVFPKIKIGGIMCFDDFKNKFWAGVGQALQEVAYGNPKLRLLKEGYREVYFEKLEN